MKILVYTTKYANRLQYIGDFIFVEIYGLEYLITTDSEEFKSFNGVKINYSESAVCTNSKPPTVVGIAGAALASGRSKSAP